MICDYCGVDCGSSFGRAKDERVACYSCCAWLDIMAMMRGEAVALYHHEAKYDPDPRVGNWPGTLRMKIVATKETKAGYRGKVTIVHFMGPLGVTWRGEANAHGHLLTAVRPLRSEKAS